MRFWNIVWLNKGIKTALGEILYWNVAIFELHMAHLWQQRDKWWQWYIWMWLLTNERKRALESVAWWMCRQDKANNSLGNIVPEHALCKSGVPLWSRVQPHLVWRVPTQSLYSLPRKYRRINVWISNKTRARRRVPLEKLTVDERSIWKAEHH